MLKHVLAFFVFMVVSLALVNADEGYIPFFPDFLEPDGIGIRADSEEEKDIILTNIELEYRFANYIPPDIQTHFKEDKENVYSNSLKTGLQNKRNSLLSFEYKKKYLFKKLIFVNQILDIYQISEKNIALSKIQEIKQDNIGSFTGRDYFTSTLIISETSNYNDLEFKNYKSILSESDFNFIKNNTNSNTKRTVNFDLETKYILFGLGIGLDLWIIEFSHGPFFMFHETDIDMKSCVIESNHILFDRPQYIDFNFDDMGEYCNNNSEKNLNIFTKKFTGFSYGYYGTVALVFFETDNWKITWGQQSKFTNFGLYDLNGKKINFKGLNIYPNIKYLDGTTEGNNIPLSLRLIYYFR